MFDDDQQTPNTLNCAFEFDLPDGKRKMMEFEVRHWITNNEAGIGRGNLVAGRSAFSVTTTRSATSSMGQMDTSPPETKTHRVMRSRWAATRSLGLTVMAGAITLQTSSTAFAAGRKRT